MLATEQVIKELVVGILAIAGFITAIGGAFTVIKGWVNASKSSKNKVKIDDHENRLIEVEKRLIHLEDKQEHTNEFVTVICNALLALLAHNINGDSKDKLEKAEQEITDFLISQK